MSLNPLANANPSDILKRGLNCEFDTSNKENIDSNPAKKFKSSSENGKNFNAENLKNGLGICKLQEKIEIDDKSKRDDLVSAPDTPPLQIDSITENLYESHQSSDKETSKSHNETTFKILRHVKLKKCTQFETPEDKNEIPDKSNQNCNKSPVSQNSANPKNLPHSDPFGQSDVLSSYSVENSNPKLPNQNSAVEVYKNILYLANECSFLCFGKEDEFFNIRQSLNLVRMPNSKPISSAICALEIQNSFPALKLAIDCGADPNLTDEFLGRNLLQHALFYQQKLPKNESKSVINSKLVSTNNMYMNDAVRKNNENNVRTLVDLIFDKYDAKTIRMLIKHKDLEGRNSLLIALQHHNLSACKRILDLSFEFGFDIKLLKERDNNGNSVLHYAADFGAYGLLELILEMNSDDKKRFEIDMKNNKGETALHIAARRDCSLIIKLLIQNGATVDSINKMGHTPLYEALFSNSIDAFNTLLTLKANIYQTDSSGVSVYEHLMLKNQQRVNFSSPPKSNQTLKDIYNDLEYLNKMARVQSQNNDYFQQDLLNHHHQIKKKLDQFPPKKRMYTNDKQHLVGPDYHHIDSTTSKLTQIEQQKRQKEELRALQIAELNKYMDKILDQHPSFGCTDKCLTDQSFNQLMTPSFDQNRLRNRSQLQLQKDDANITKFFHHSLPLQHQYLPGEYAHELMTVPCEFDPPKAKRKPTPQKSKNF